MKKFVTLLLLVTLCMVPMLSFAETFRGEALWAISSEQHITGILSPDQVENHFGPQAPAKPYVRGFLDNGLVREKGLQQYVVSTSGQHGGFTTLKTVITIFPQYEEIVAEVVTDKCEYTPDSVMDYVFATMYFEGNYVGHVFFKTNVPTFYVGDVTVNNGKDTFKLLMGDWDNDGKYDLGFAPGWTPCKKPEPEPEPEPPMPQPQPEPQPQPQPQKQCNKPSCQVKVCQPVFQFNLFSIVKNYFSGCKR